MTTTGLLGRIDAATHLLSNGSPMPDIDVIALQVPARTLLTITVTPYGPDASINPILEVGDHGSFWTFNDDTTLDDLASRTVIAAPYKDADKWIYVRIADLANGQGDSGFSGGAGYDYLVEFAADAFAPVALGTLADATPTLEHTGVLPLGGDIEYVSFWAAPDAAFQVSVVDTNTSADFVPYAIGMQSKDDLMIWKSRQHGEQTVTLAEDAFDPCEEPCDALVEWFFAVTDYSGWPGPFTYTATVTLTAP